MAGAFFFIVFVVVAIFIIRHVVTKTKRRAAEWSLAAQSLGVDYLSSGLPFQSGSVQGECQGVWINVTLHSESSGKSSTTFTRYVVQFPESLPLELRLTRQGYFHGVASFFGVQDIEIGDPDFDALVIIKGDDEGAVREFLDADRRQEITDIYAAFERVSIDRHQIVAMDRGAAEDQLTLVHAVELLVGAARGIGGAGPVPAPSMVAPVPRLRFVADEEPHEADDLISEIRNSWAEGKSFLGAPMMGVGSGRHEVFEPYPPPEPTWESERATDPELEPGEADIDEVEPETEPEEPEETFLAPTAELAAAAEPEASPPPVETREAASGASAAELCEMLFGDNASGYEVDQRFTPHAGQRVLWSGTLRDASEFDLDFELGSGSGTRAVFEVHQVTSTLGSADAITAVVRFPEGYEQQLGELVGERVAFEARLDKVKGLMKELILIDGELSGSESEER